MRGPRIPESLAGEYLSPTQRRFLSALVAVRYSMARPIASRRSFPARFGTLLFPVGMLLLGMAVSSFFWASRPISPVTAASSNGVAEVAREAEPTVAPLPVLVVPTVPTHRDLRAEPSATATYGPTASLEVATPSPASTPVTATETGSLEPTMTAKAEAVTTHVVARGENLYRIALRYGTTADAIAARNGIADLSNVRAGQVLVIP